jgi:hypothetical protein
MKLLLTSLLLTLSISAADCSGKWSGNFVDDADKNRTEATYMVLAQDGNKVTGTAGPSADQHMQISNGKIDGETITFDVKNEVVTMHFSLKLLDEHLKGKLSVSAGGQTQTATVDLAMVE